MPLFRTPFLLRVLSLFHLFISYTLLHRPHVLPTHPLVLMLGSSMRVPDPRSPSLLTTSPALGLVALLLALLALSDLSATMLPDTAYEEHWGVQAPSRVVFFFTLAAWIYGTKGGSQEGWGVLRNGVVFSWAFLELVAMFWVFTSLKEERRERVVKLAMERERREKLQGEGF